MKTCKECSKKLENRNKTGYCKDHVKNRRTHGMSKTRTYKTFCEMKARCLNPRATKYEYYGGKGISVCERWMKFENFYKDMGKRPEGMTLDRINSNGNYEPTNCRWATAKQQGNNRCCMVHYKGLNYSDWDKKLGFKRGTMRARRKKSKWSWEKAVSTPKFSRRN